MGLQSHLFASPPFPFTSVASPQIYLFCISAVSHHSVPAFSFVRRFFPFVDMFLGSTVFGALGALTTWVLVQWLLRRVAPQNAVVRSINYFLQAVIDHVVFGCGTLVALLLLSPYLLGVASELFRFLRTQVASLESKSLLDWVAHILEKLDVIGKEMRQASTNLEENCPTDTKRIDQRLRNDSVVSPGPSALSQSCGKVLLAVSEYNKSLDRLFSALQPTELEVRCSVLFPVQH